MSDTALTARERAEWRAKVAAVLSGQSDLGELYDALGADDILTLLDTADEVAKLRAEVERLRRDMKGMVSGFRSHLGDLINRIGPARRPEDIKAALEDIYNGYNAWGDKSDEQRIAALEAENATLRDRFRIVQTTKWRASDMVMELEERIATLEDERDAALADNAKLRDQCRTLEVPHHE